MAWQEQFYLALSCHFRCCVFQPEITRSILVSLPLPSVVRRPLAYKNINQSKRVNLVVSPQPHISSPISLEEVWGPSTVDNHGPRD